MSATDTIPLRQVNVDVVDEPARAGANWTACVIDQDIRFSAEHLLSFAFANFEPIVFDTLVVAAAIEFCDRIAPRSSKMWGREFVVRIAVHDPARWNDSSIANPLHETLNLLTGNKWNLVFVRRARDYQAIGQSHLFSLDGVNAVIAFSEGLDSKAVSGLFSREMGNSLVRVRVGEKLKKYPVEEGRRVPFTGIPYSVTTGDGHKETSFRSRGFKFASVSGLAAYLTGAREIIMTESGQGALGPALLPVGQGYPDYRNHPLFTIRMAKFLNALFGTSLSFRFPRLWSTKGATLAAYIREYGDQGEWRQTRSCWQGPRQMSTNGDFRQCGICAACMLRRQSVHAAGLTEMANTYVWENISAHDFEQGASGSFTKMTPALREYAVAGTLHLDHLAAMADNNAEKHVKARLAAELSEALGQPLDDVRQLLADLLSAHAAEWKAFVNSLGPGSFVTGWASAA